VIALLCTVPVWTKENLIRLLRVSKGAYNNILAWPFKHYIKKYSGTRNIVFLWTLVDNFFYNFGVAFITNLKRVINLP
jgi:hypothetical protein